jgi:hypothetical protein
VNPKLKILPGAALVEQLSNQQLLYTPTSFS